MSHVTQRLVFTLLILLALASCAAPGVPEQAAAPTSEPPTAAPTFEPTPLGLEDEASSVMGGFKLRFPAGWASRELSGTLELAASQEQLDGGIPGDTLVLRVDSAPLTALADQYGSAVISDTQAFFDASASGISGATITNTKAISVAGRLALAADVQSDGAAGRIVALLAPPQGVRVLAQAAPAAWPKQRELFERIIESISVSEPPPPPTATPRPDQATQPQRLSASAGNSIPSFMLRLGGNSGSRGGRFTSARGLAAAADGTLYMAESSQGIWVFGPDGTLVRTFGKGELLDAYDVALGPDGAIYVADFGRNAITRFRPNGELALRWGSAGEGPEQFGLLAPQRIAVGANGTVYALDSRVSQDSRSTLSRVLRFRGDNGSFIGAFDLPKGSSPNDIAVDKDGNLYLAETFGGAIVKLDATGKVVARLGEKVTDDGITAGAIDLDPDGNLLVATWSDGVVKLSPAGTLLAQAGAVAAGGSIPQPGQFSLPNGIAVAGGGVVWVSDNSGEYSAITALRLETSVEAEATAEADATAAALANATGTPVRTSISQWASSASASSQYDDSYAASNTTGPPNAPGCSSGIGSWASVDPNGQDTLEVGFKTPVFATSIYIHQNHQPGFITSVELIDEQGASIRVYGGKPQLDKNCPEVLRISFQSTAQRIVGAKITLDQRTGASWNEIDAVELVGGK